MSEKKQCYKPGFFCALFWFITWAGIVCGIVPLFLTLENAAGIMIWAWSIGGVSAVISYIIRTVEKSRFDGRWSCHWFD